MMNKENKTSFIQCCFCNKFIDIQYGNNPAPLEDSRKHCCNDCNEKLVIPARIETLKNKKDIF